MTKNEIDGKMKGTGNRAKNEDIKYNLNSKFVIKKQKCNKTNFVLCAPSRMKSYTQDKILRSLCLQYNNSK